VTIKGLNARILKQNCAWDSIVTCHDVLEIGDKRNFRVTAIRKDLGELQVSLRQVSDDPWKTNAIPKRDEVLEVIVVRDCGRGYLCKTDGGLEVTLPKSEVSWLTLTGTDKELSVDSRHDVVVYSINPDHRRIEVSMRRLENNPWPALAKRFSKGTKLRGKVIKTTPQFVHIDLGEGIIGGVPKDRMVAAGHEYASYEKSVVPGQGLDVVVTEVLVGNRIIKLDLQRNLAASPSVKQRTKTAGQK
jgi:ribosomal protein S1